eukprot:753925-Hanusia_phi.AAC.1
MHTLRRPQFQLRQRMEQAADLVRLHAPGVVTKMPHHDLHVPLIQPELQLRTGHEVGRQLPSIALLGHLREELIHGPMQDIRELNVEIGKRCKQAHKVALALGEVPQRLPRQPLRYGVKHLLGRPHVPLAVVPDDVDEAVDMENRNVLTHKLAQLRRQLLVPVDLTPDQVVQDRHEGALVHGGEKEPDVLADGLLQVPSQRIIDLRDGQQQHVELLLLELLHHPQRLYRDPLVEALLRRDPLLRVRPQDHGDALGSQDRQVFHRGIVQLQLQAAFQRNLKRRARPVEHCDGDGLHLGDFLLGVSKEHVQVLLLGEVLEVRKRPEQPNHSEAVEPLHLLHRAACQVVKHRLQPEALGLDGSPGIVLGACMADDVHVASLRPQVLPTCPRHHSELVGCGYDVVGVELVQVLDAVCDQRRQVLLILDELLVLFGRRT